MKKRVDYEAMMYQVMFPTWIEFETDSEKDAFLRDHWALGEYPGLDGTLYCLHCGQAVKVRDLKCFGDEDSGGFMCGTPGCDGSPLDLSLHQWGCYS